MAVLGGPVSSAYAKPPATKAPAGQPHTRAIVIEVSHKPPVKLPTKAHSAGHKIA